MMKNNGKVSKVLAFCLTLLMVVGLFGTIAFADVTPNSTGTISVTGVEEGVTVSAYRLMNVKVNDNGQPQEPVYTWVDEVANWVRTNYPDYIGKDTNNSVQAAFSEADTTDIAKFYDTLAAAIKVTEGPLSITAAGTCDGSGSIENLKMGNYLILIENGMKVYSPSAVNLVPVWSDGKWQMSTATVEVKSSELTITKTVKAPGTTTGQEKDNANIGDTVTFDIVTDIPQFPVNALAKNYAISDTLPTGLTLTEGSIQVYGIIGDIETELVNGETTTYYTRVTQRPNNNSTSTFTLNFDYTQISRYSQIHITYTATLNGKAELGNSGNENTAYLDYSNNPYTETSWQSKSDKATVYTYGLDISKVDKKDNNNFLSGAEFELYASKEDATNGTNKISFVMDTEGVYHKAVTGESDQTTTLTVGENDGLLGKLTLKGLDKGTWYLKEITAPDGYNLLASPVAVEIADNDLNGSVTVNEQNIDTGLVPLTVENDNGFQLPVTGGMGTILFTTIGIVLMGAAIILMVIVLKKKKANR